MKVIKRMALAVSLVLLATGVFAGCLSTYNQQLYDCEGQYTFERMGCKTDAFFAYYACIGRAALS